MDTGTLAHAPVSLNPLCLSLIGGTSLGLRRTLSGQSREPTPTAPALRLHFPARTPVSDKKRQERQKSFQSEI